MGNGSFMDNYLSFVYTMTGRDLADIEASGQTVDEAISQFDREHGFGEDNSSDGY